MIKKRISNFCHLIYQVLEERVDGIKQLNDIISKYSEGMSHQSV